MAINLIIVLLLCNRSLQRNAALVADSLTVLKYSVALDENVRIRFEY